MGGGTGAERSGQICLQLADSIQLLNTFSLQRCQLLLVKHLNVSGARKILKCGLKRNWFGFHAKKKTERYSVFRSIFEN